MTRLEATADAAAATASELAVPTGPAAVLATPPGVALVRARADRRPLAMAAASSAVLFGLVRAGRTHDVDVAVSRAIQRVGRPVAPLLGAVSWPGFPPQSRLIPPAFVGALWIFGLRLEAAFQLVAWSGAVIASALKALARRPRPAHSDAIEIVAGPIRGSSFPSGHVLTYIGVYGFLATIVQAHARDRRVGSLGRAGLLALVALVGPSRVQQGHHWPSDVLGSYLVGLPLLALLVEAYGAAKARLLRGRR